MAKAQAKPGPKSAVGSDGLEKYAWHVVIFIVVVLAASLAVYFVTHSKIKAVKKENYESLPQITSSSESQVVRMQVTVQVNDKDAGWLAKNKNSINEIVKTTVDGIDPVTFRTSEGRVAVQEKLRDEINAKMKVDKIEAILYNDLLVQKKVNE